MLKKIFKVGMEALKDSKKSKSASSSRSQNDLTRVAMKIGKELIKKKK